MDDKEILEEEISIAEKDLDVITDPVEYDEQCVYINELRKELKKLVN